MADVRRGRLIAIDGADGPEVADAATTLYDRLAERGTASGVSRWDASGLFSDVVSAPAANRDVSPRTLVLLYASDLAFRLRWEIGPALDQGLVVIAAPYVATVIALGRGAGLSDEWLRALFRFAPDPVRTVLLRARKSNRTWKRKPERGFAECCTSLLSETPEGFERKRTRATMIGALATEAEELGGFSRRKDLRAIASALSTRKKRQ